MSEPKYVWQLCKRCEEETRKTDCGDGDGTNLGADLSFRAMLSPRRTLPRSTNAYSILKCAQYLFCFCSRRSHIINKWHATHSHRQQQHRQQQQRWQPCTRLPQPITENEFNISSKIETHNVHHIYAVGQCATERAHTQCEIHIA